MDYEDFAFSLICGLRTGFSANRRTAYRKDSSSCYDGAVALSDRRLRRREFFEIRIDSLRADKWTGSLAIGVVKCAPYRVDLASIDTFNDLPLSQGNTWSLSENEVRNNNKKVLCSKYPLNLDNLAQGARVGLMVRENGELHFYLNGKDMGCAATGIPKGVYAVVDLYGQCCELSIIPKDQVSVRSTPVMEEGGQEEEEEWIENEDEVATTVSTHHSGSGLNTMDFAGQVLPPPAVDFAGQVLPPPAVDFTMQALTSSSTMPSSASTLSATVKKEWDFTGQVLPHEQPHLVRKAESLSVGSRTRTEKVPEQADVTRRNAELKFSEHCGRNIRLGRDSRSAVRVVGYNESILLSEKKLPNDKVFEVRIQKMSSEWEGTISLGITTLQPSKACRFKSAAQIAHSKSDTWVFYLDHLYRNGKEVKNLYVNLSKCKEGETVGMFCSQDPSSGSDTWYLVLNGRNIHRLAVKVPRERYAVVDVYGQCVEVELLPLRDAAPPKEETQVKAGKGRKQPKPYDDPHSLRAPRKGREDTSRPQRSCSYKDICGRYLSTLHLPDCYFEPTPEHNKCFCLECHAWRKDRETYSRGTPPAVYALPLGWCRFALKAPPRAQSVNAFRDYHIAFHGTNAACLRKILDSGSLLLPGDISLGGEVVSPPSNHYTEDWKPQDHDTSQIFLSPSIKYAGCSAYAPPDRFVDPDSGKAYNAKVALQVLIRPRSYEVGPETVGATQKGITIDPHIPNTEIEWSTKEKPATILYGLLIELRED